MCQNATKMEREVEHCKQKQHAELMNTQNSGSTVMVQNGHFRHLALWFDYTECV